MDLTGYPDGPPAKMGSSLADIVAGLYAFHGILLALLARHRTGQGQAIDISLLDGMVSTLTYQAMSYFATGRSPQRMGTKHPSITPYECFQAKDGYVSIGATNEKQWVNLCVGARFSSAGIGRALFDSAARMAHYDELKPLIDGAVSKMTRDEAMQRMAEVDIAVGPVNTVAEVLADPQIHAREMVEELTHPSTAAQVPRRSDQALRHPRNASNGSTALRGAQSRGSPRAGPERERHCGPGDGTGDSGDVRAGTANCERAVRHAVVADQAHARSSRLARTGFITSRRVLTADSPIRARRQDHLSRGWRLRRERGGPVRGHPRRGYETSSTQTGHDAGLTGPTNRRP